MSGYGTLTPPDQQPQKEYLTVEITKTVPVADRETLEAYLNIGLENHIGKNLRGTAGTRALEMIEEAGFELRPPKVARSTSGHPGTLGSGVLSS